MRLLVRLLRPARQTPLMQHDIGTFKIPSAHRRPRFSPPPGCVCPFARRWCAQSFDDATVKSSDIWMPIYIGDYLSDTLRLTTEQHGAYLLLIMDYWKQGAPPDKDEVLASITRCSKDAWAMLRPFLEPFFKIQNGRWEHKRVEQEKAKAVAQSETFTKRASHAAKSRWGRRKSESYTSSIVKAPPQAIVEHVPSPSPSHVQKTQPEASNGKLECVRSAVNALIKRPPTDRWTYAEEHALAEICQRPDILTQLKHIQEYRQKIRNSEFFPRSVIALLEGWSKTLDHARNCPEPKAW